MGLKKPGEISRPCGICENECPPSEEIFRGYFIASTDKENLERCLEECNRCTLEWNGYKAKRAAKKVGVYYKELANYDDDEENVVVNDNTSWNDLRPLTPEEADEIRGG